MTTFTLDQLQVSLQDKAAFGELDDYAILCHAYLTYLEEAQPTRIISPYEQHYVFFQYSEAYDHKITRPLNSKLYIESAEEFATAFERFGAFLEDLRKHEASIVDLGTVQAYLASNELNKLIYTVQQTVGNVADSFRNPNQARKRVGQLFEGLVKLILQEVGFECESRKITVPLPDHPDYTMSYDLDLVFSRGKAVIASETEVLIHPDEIVGSVKTTSKDRIDKIFLDKFMLSKLLGREIPLIAIFLHDVQRAKRRGSIFGIASTFKRNHFLGYTVALNRLDGVYYVDPRPDMVTDEVLQAEIDSFQRFLVHDLWEF
jgi:hypothetical protein